MIVFDKNIIKSIGQYRVLKKIGTGGFSQIYLVEDSEKNEQFVLKAIKNPNNKIRIKHEIDILHHVNEHPNILTFHACFKDSGRLFFKFDHIEQGDMKNFIKKNGSLDETEALEFLKQMCDVLLFLKQKGVIHKDIKETNILKKESTYYLCDFGVSEHKSVIETLHIKADDDIVAPEVFCGEYGFASDIYSLGCTLYYVSTGQYVYGFDKKSSYAYKMYAHCKLQPDVSLIESDKLKYLILRMTDKNPQTRMTLEEIMEVISTPESQYSIEFENVDYETHKRKNNIELYHLLSEDGIVFATNNLALEYDEELKDYKKAFVLYKKAAIDGFIKAMYNIGLCYLNAEGTAQDYAKSFAWLKKAALKKHEKAVYKLGEFYENGWYVEKNINKAIALFIESANLGNKKAYKKLHELKNSKIVN